MFPDDPRANTEKKIAVLEQSNLDQNAQKKQNLS